MKSFLALSLAFSLVVGSSATAQATSYSVAVAANSKDLCSYCFDTNSLTNALPNAPDGTTVWWWDASAQAYYSSTLRPSGWTTSHNLSPGEGFFIQNNGTNAYTFTVQGTAPTAATYTMSFPTSTYYYLIGSAYPITAGNGNWLECMQNCSGGYQYTDGSYNYVGHNGDTVWFWCPDAQAWSPGIVRTNGPHCTPAIAEWLNTSTGGGYTCLFGSPQLTWGSENCGGSLNNGGIGRGFFLQPAGGTASWTHLPTNYPCR